MLLKYAQGGFFLCSSRLLPPYNGPELVFIEIRLGFTATYLLMLTSKSQLRNMARQATRSLMAAWNMTRVRPQLLTLSQLVRDNSRNKPMKT